MEFVLLILFGLLALISFIWLVVVAFKRHVGWGLFVFIGSFILSIIPAIIYAIADWRKAKLPFLVYMGTNILAAIVAFNMLIPMMGDIQMLAEKQARGEISEAEMQQQILTAMLNKMPIDIPVPNLPAEQPAVEEQPATAPEEPQARQPEAVQEDRVIRRKSFIPLALDKVAGHIGDTMKVYSKDGNERSGTLERVEPDSLHFQQRVYNGSMLFEVRKKDIQKLEVLGFRDY